MTHTPQLTEAHFLQGVEQHQMIVIADGGVYRHLRFGVPNSGIARFDILTWPGHLCYTGDMGTYVFSAPLPDMFLLFRRDPEQQLVDGQKLAINPGYWAEKLLATQVHEGFEEFSPEVFASRIKEWLDDAGATDAVREAVQEKILNHIDDGEQVLLQTVMEFNEDGFTFAEFYEVDCNDFTFRYLWCCYALTWAVEFYDEMKAAVAAEEAAAAEAAAKEAEGQPAASALPAPAEHPGITE